MRNDKVVLVNTGTWTIASSFSITSCGTQCYLYGAMNYVPSKEWIAVATGDDDIQFYDLTGAL